MRKTANAKSFRMAKWFPTACKDLAKMQGQATMTAYEMGDDNEGKRIPKPSSETGCHHTE